MATKRSPRDADSKATARDRWAELADLVLVVAREIQFRGYTDERALRLSQSEGMVVRYLQQQPDAAPSQVAAATGLQRTNLSTVLRGLEEKGLIERRAGLEDRRGVVIHLTALGKSNYALVRKEWAAEVADAAGHDTTHLDAALALLSAMRDGLVEARDAQSPSTLRR